MVRVMLFTLFLSTVWVRLTWCDLNDFQICHDDFSLTPIDGVLPEFSYPWLGFVQYINEGTQLLHPTTAPRIVLIQKQFALSIAKELLNLPNNYKIGNAIFGDYEREELDCNLNLEEISYARKCPRVYMEIPLLDIVPHPEYIRFNARNSIAVVKLIRPMKSNYMIPICLPSITERARQKRIKTVMLIDYISAVPKDFDFERMGQRTLKLFTHRECFRYQIAKSSINNGITHILCTSGCGMRPGSPIITHATDGRFELIGLAIGGAPCSDKDMRRQVNSNLPHYIDVYPYNQWIINIITAHRIPKPYPQRFQLVNKGYMSLKNQADNSRTKSGWKGRTYLSGRFCFRDASTIKQHLFFYAEQFSVTPNTEIRPTQLTVKLKISAGIECTIACARLIMPHRMVDIQINGIEGFNITVYIKTRTFTDTFKFAMGLSGYNTSRDNFYLWRTDLARAYPKNPNYSRVPKN